MKSKRVLCSECIGCQSADKRKSCETLCSASTPLHRCLSPVQERLVKFRYHPNLIHKISFEMEQSNQSESEFCTYTEVHFDWFSGRQCQLWDSKMLIDIVQASSYLGQICSKKRRNQNLLSLEKLLLEVLTPSNPKIMSGVNQAFIHLPYPAWKILQLQKQLVQNQTGINLTFNQFPLVS